MKTPVHAAIEAVSAVLARENAALAALDLVRAGGFLAEKRAATDALALALVAGTGTLPAPAQAEQLRDLAGENRRLLERAIAVQGRVIAVIARAVPRNAVAPRYAAHGGMARAPRPLPVALSARA
jgi:hypothetical protein